MIAQSEIRQMPLPEKVALLEAVWAELSMAPDQVEVPQWHKDLLDERHGALEQGLVAVLDWENAKNQINQAIQ